MYGQGVPCPHRIMILRLGQGVPCPYMVTGWCIV